MPWTQNSLPTTHILENGTSHPIGGGLRRRLRGNHFPDLCSSGTILGLAVRGGGGPKTSPGGRWTNATPAGKLSDVRGVSLRFFHCHAASGVSHGTCPAV